MYVRKGEVFLGPETGARKTEQACGNSMHFLIEFSLLRHACLKKPCRPAPFVAENFRFSKVKLVALCCHE